jgi:hypothetical protein
LYVAAIHKEITVRTDTDEFAELDFIVDRHELWSAKLGVSHI